jgi:hypothetical protein
MSQSDKTVDGGTLPSNVFKLIIPTNSSYNNLFGIVTPVSKMWQCVYCDRYNSGLRRDYCTSCQKEQPNKKILSLTKETK